MTLRGPGELDALRLLVVIASYGSKNDSYLNSVIQEYRSMSFEVDIVVISNVDKRAAAGIECIVGLPNSNPWSLPFAHKKLFADRIGQYDLFIYSEDDMLITEDNIQAFLEAGPVLEEGEIAGFLRVEYSPNGQCNFPEVHGHFRWDCESVRVRGRYVLAHFTNEHSACYILTKQQLAKAIASGGFLVAPHGEKYDLLCSAATDPYTQCGFKKLIPISHIGAFCVHHLPNKYVRQLGVNWDELDAQICELLRIGSQDERPVPLLSTETNLWHRMYSKDRYEPIRDEVLALISQGGARILSIGSGLGATERRLVEAGCRVAAVPLDPVISSRSAQSGVVIVPGDLAAARAQLSPMRFDCILYLNILQFVRHPQELLRLFVDVLTSDGKVIITTPNLPYVRYLWRSKKTGETRLKCLSFETSGIHNTSIAKIRRWCAGSELSIEKALKVSSHADRSYISSMLPPEIVAIARRA